MTKKFISLLISVIMVVSLIPVMSVSAESTVYIDIDFETFTAGSVKNEEYNKNNRGSLYDTGNSKTATNLVNVQTNVKAEIKNVSGPDGNMTNVVEFTVNSCGGFDNSQNGLVKFYFGPKYTEPGTPSTFSPSGLVVYDMDIYIDENTLKNAYMYPIAIQGNNIGVAQDYGKLERKLKEVSNGWHHITAVVDLNETSKNIIGYVDGECISYKYYTRTSVTNTFQPYGRNMPGYQKLLVDNVKVYNPAVTIVSSTYSDASGLSKTVSPVVTFSESVFDYSSHSDGRIADKVELIATSGATPIDIDISLSNDGKTLTIDPKENLNLGTEYTVKLTGLVDMYGREITDTEFNFTTAEASPITVSQPVFTKENLFAAGGASQTITALENGYIKASATVSNSANTAKEVMVLSMLKEGEDIKYFQFDNLTVPANGSAAFTGGFQIDNASTQKIETVVWDNITNKTPLADKYAFSASGYVKTDLDTLLGE